MTDLFYASLMTDRDHGITIVGLGPGSIHHLTVEATDVLQSADRVFVRTAQHPTVSMMSDRFPALDIIPFDDVYESAHTFDEVYGQIVSRIIEAARESPPVIYCVPGSPSIDETTVQLLSELARDSNIPLRIVQGLSYIEPVLAAVNASSITWLTVVDGAELNLLAQQDAFGRVPKESGTFPIREPTPSAPLLVSQIYSTHIAGSVKLWLSRYWPEEHEVHLIKSAGTASQTVLATPLYKLDRCEVDHLTALYVPAIEATQDTRTLTGLITTARTLRAPGGCPWDREQTHASLKPHLVEETYEVTDALDSDDPDALCEELGDLLFQVVIHSQIARELDQFDMTDVISSISAKLIRRHPHVFSDLDLPNSAAVLGRWESFKQAEKPGRESILSNIPKAMPALPYSTAIQKRAANQGFDWPDIESMLRKIDEELGELRAEIESDADHAQILAEYGDLLFALVSLGRKLGVDPEEALRKANQKFVKRFNFVELVASDAGRRLSEHSAAELDGLWQEAKAQS